MPLPDALGRLLWRRVYEARVNANVLVHLLPDTLKALLEQAGVPEPEDDVVTTESGARWHGRTVEAIKPFEEA